jgi:hypothetical protein
MSFLRILKDKSQLQGTAYIELLPGKYKGTCWNRGSLFLDEDTFGFFEGIVVKNLPDYDHYAFTEVTTPRWEPIIAKLNDFAAELRAARSPADLPADIYYFMNDTEQRFLADFSGNVQLLHQVSTELVGWLEAQAKQHDTITILGL